MAHPVTHENEPCIGSPGPGPRPGLGRGLGPGPCPGLRPGPGYVAGRFEQAIFETVPHAPGAHPVTHENPTRATDCTDFTDLESV